MCVGRGAVGGGGGGKNGDGEKGGKYQGGQGWKLFHNLGLRWRGGRAGWAGVGGDVG